MIVELPAELVLARAREVRERLLQALASGEALELDPTHVESIDVAGLQLLCGLHKSTFTRGRRRRRPERTRRARGLPKTPGLHVRVSVGE
jgi:anti-anti-sigma regulatory factor